IQPRVAMDGAGGFVVAWQINAFSMGTPLGIDVGARRFLWNGADGGHWRVNTYATGNQVQPAVAWSYGDFVITWLGYGQDSPSDLGALVYAQRFTPGLHGDVNGDGKVDVSDVFYLINFLFASGPPPLGAADLNGEGKVDVSDVFYLINYLFAGGAPPA
ncbi:MAG TPA: dockerin type I domain-containing protein, partial [Thermoanaerobaculia bacterium]|nr:dockerin type I domain-containing protein [Thermoanaerobaculia bacterium]